MEASGLTSNDISELECKTIECKISVYEEKIKQWDYLAKNYSEEITKDDLELRKYWVETLKELKNLIKTASQY